MATRKKRKAKRRQPAQLARYWASRKAGTKKRRRATAQENTPVQRKKRSSGKTQKRVRTRKGRMNPGGLSLIPSSGFLREVAFTATGFYATKITAGFVLPMVGISGPLPRIAVKAGLAIGISMLGGMILGSRAKESLLLGGALEVAADAIKTFVAPYVPLLASSEMESYYLPTSLEGPAEDGIQGQGNEIGSYYNDMGALPSDLEA